MEDPRPTTVLASNTTESENGGSKDIDILTESIRGRLCHKQDESSWKLCPPKLLPLKTFTVEKLEKLQKEAEEQLRNAATD